MLVATGYTTASKTTATTACNDEPQLTTATRPLAELWSRMSHFGLGGSTLLTICS